MLLRLRPALLLVVLSLLVAVGFLTLMLGATNGHFVPPVVDFYVVAQYARAWADGHPFEYNLGEPGSTGATSLLHTAVLAGAHALGARGEGLVAFATLLGCAFFLTSVQLARRVGARLGDPHDGFLAGALVALGGPVVWGFCYGSDIAVFMLLALWLLERMLAEWERPRPWGVLAAGTLLALARPEGLPMGLMLGALLSARGPARDRRSLVLAWVPAAAGLLVLGLYRWQTGAWLGTSVADKSLLANYGLSDSLAIVSEYGMDVLRGLLLGFYPAETPVGFAQGWSPYYLPPFGLLLILALAARPTPVARLPLRVWLLITATIFVLVAPNVFAGVHFNRYLLWAFPALLALTAAGLSTAARGVARGNAFLERGLYRWGAGLCLLCGLLSTVRFATLYAEMAGSVYRRDVAAATWISRNLPAGVAMANAATSVEYLTGHRNLNLHGVTSPAFFGNLKAEREAGTWESLVRLPPAQRPDYLISSVSAQQAYATLRELVAGPPLYQTSSLSDEIQIYRVGWELVGTAGQVLAADSLAATAGLEEVDRLNICDRAAEARHGYRFDSRLGNQRLHGTPQVAHYPGGESGPGHKIVDAGRAILGHEAFSIATRPGRDLIVVTRTVSSLQANVLRASGSTRFGLELPETLLRIEVDGRPAVEMTIPLGPGWNEHAVRLSGSLIRAERTRLRLSGRYSSFHYWFFQ